MPSFQLGRGFLGPISIIWLSYGIVSIAALGVYFYGFFHQPPRPEFTEKDIHSIQQVMVKMQNGEWNTDQAIANLDAETKVKIHQMGMTEKEFLTKMTIDLVSNQLGIDLNTLMKTGR